MDRPPLLSSAALRDRLGEPSLRVVDASWHLPAAGRDAAREFAEAHVPGAVFFDIDAHSAPGALPHMLPTPERFAAAAGSLGIAENDDIVVYDTLGLFSAPRVRWMFRRFGARRVALLDGGLPAWIAAGGPLESGVPTTASVRFAAGAAGGGAGEEVGGVIGGKAGDGVGGEADGSAGDGRDEGAGGDTGSKAGTGTDGVATAADVLRASRTGAATVIDARSRARFAGEEAEARPGLRSGHVPGSVSLPFTELLDEGRLKPDDALRALFAERGVPLERPIVTTCGSGVTAAVISLALERLGARDVSLYDGSWAEWGGRDELPVERG